MEMSTQEIPEAEAANLLLRTTSQLETAEVKNEPVIEISQEDVNNLEQNKTSNLEVERTCSQPDEDEMAGACDPLVQPCAASLLLELRNDIKLMKTALLESNKTIANLTEEVQQSKAAIDQLTEEVKTVKLENRQFNSATTNVQMNTFENLPFYSKEDLQNFDAELQNNEELFEQFRLFILRTGGEGAAQFLRSAVRKVFSDELASLYSWKGTIEKPSAQKTYVISTIKNICQNKYKADDRDMHSILQKHFVHAKERAVKRKRTQ